jgi:hypothetical protein
MTRKKEENETNISKEVQMKRKGGKRKRPPRDKRENSS